MMLPPERWPITTMGRCTLWRLGSHRMGLAAGDGLLPEQIEKQTADQRTSATQYPHKTPGVT